MYKGSNPLRIKQEKKMSDYSDDDFEASNGLNAYSNNYAAPAPKPSDPVGGAGSRASPLPARQSWTGCAEAQAGGWATP